MTSTGDSSLSRVDRDEDYEKVMLYGIGVVVGKEGLNRRLFPTVWLIKYTKAWLDQLKKSLFALFF